MLTWTRMDALEMVGNVKILNVFWRQSQRDLLMDWFCSVGEKAKGDPKACHPSYRDGVAICCSYNKASSARLLHSSAVSESSECSQKPSWAGGHVWKEKRRESYAIHCNPQVGVGITGHVCLSRFMSDQKKKKKSSLWLLPASRAPSPRVVFQVGSNWEIIANISQRWQKPQSQPLVKQIRDEHEVQQWRTAQLLISSYK